MPRPRIRPFAARSLSDTSELNYDSALASLGYEQRSREIPEVLSTTGLAVPFGDRQEGEWATNKAFFKDRNWKLAPIETEDWNHFETVRAWLGEVVQAGHGKARVAVDVSSMTRPRIADIVEAVVSLPTATAVEVDFLYTPAAFEDPDPELEPPVFAVEPVSGYFAGWWSALERPLLAIVGLGYELERAASALDVLEPERVEVYVPEGTDARYLEAVEKANHGLIGVEHEDQDRIYYAVGDPFTCFRRLEASLARHEADHRLALVPLGPKIFALAATLAAALHPAGSQVIRVSAGERQAALPRRSDGSLFGLTVAISRPADAEVAAATAPTTTTK